MIKLIFLSAEIKDLNFFLFFPIISGFAGSKGEMGEKGERGPTGDQGTERTFFNIIFHKKKYFTL